MSAESINMDEEITVSVYLKPTEPLPELSEKASLREQYAREAISEEEYARRYEPTVQDIEVVKDFAKTNHLSVQNIDKGRGVIDVSGSLSALAKAFGVDFQYATSDDPRWKGQRFRTVKGPVRLPSQIQCVTGLDTLPGAVPHAAVATQQPAGNARTLMQLANMYQFPEDVDGTGQTIAILALRGAFDPADIKEHFNRVAIKQPSIEFVPVNRATNAVGATFDLVEVEMAIEVVGTIAPGAKIVVYFGSNHSSSTALDLISSAIDDATRKPSIISISWGFAESAWSPAIRQTIDDRLRRACARGISVLASSGDGGAKGDGNGATPNVNYPASSLYCTGCGGTRLNDDGSETVWNSDAGASGGGFSAQYSRPPYQLEPGNVRGTDVSGNAEPENVRGMPDVSGNADPETGCAIFCAKAAVTTNGTSAVAPLWAGLIALLNQKRGKNLGFLNPWLYSLPAGVLNDIVGGDNSVPGVPGFRARPGWDAASGLGSPNGQRMAQHLP